MNHTKQDRSFLVANEFNAAGVARIIAKLDLKQPMEVIIRPWEEKRTNAQNKRLWAILEFIARQYAKENNGEWHDPEVWHEYLKKRILGLEVDYIRGEVVLKAHRTRDKGKKWFAEYSDKLIAVAATELGLDMAGLSDFEKGLESERF